MTLVVATVDLVRPDTKASAWHVVALPDETVTLCAWPIPDGARHEDGVDAHVVSLHGRVVCSQCRRKLA